MNCT